MNTSSIQLLHLQNNGTMKLSKQIHSNRTDNLYELIQSLSISFYLYGLVLCRGMYLLDAGVCMHLDICIGNKIYRTNDFAPIAWSII